MRTNKFLICIVTLLCISLLSNGQILNRVKRKVEQRANQKVDQTIDKGIDKTEEAAKSDKTKKDTVSKNTTAKSGTPGSTEATDETEASAKGPAEFKTYAKFDFIPGDKIVAVEDFSKVAPGDFPDKWNTNSTGDIQTVDGRTGNWLSIAKPGIFLPEFITALPENFTLEFELYCSKNYSFYSSPFNVIFASLKNPGKEFSNWRQYGPGPREGVLCWFHPQDAGMKNGHSGYKVYGEGKELMENEGNTAQFRSKENNYVKVSIWRQKNRLRVYMNEEKIWDVPRAFLNDVNYNTLLIMRHTSHNPEDRFLFSNIRLAVGAADTRNRLVTEGKFVTRGILFDVNSDKIKGESYGVLKDISTVLKDNPDLKVKVIGHTDTDGDDKSNLDLSKRRAESVKAILSKEFAIDATRIQTDGKGESEPVDKNYTNEGKANNRRVEFIKL